MKSPRGWASIVEWQRWQYKKRRRCIVKGTMEPNPTDRWLRESRLERGGVYTFQRRMAESRARWARFVEESRP